MRQKSKAVFFDRDGVINIDKSYLYKIEDFEFCDGIFELMRHLESLGYKLFVVTNQSGISRGYYSEQEFEKLTSWMIKEFEKRDIKIEKVYHCPHAPDDRCECRKPKPKMIQNALNSYKIDPLLSWMIGDKPSDIEAANSAGIYNTVFLSSKNEKYPQAKYSVKSLYDIINIIND
jgi:D-glycero-D-manno-heptose 1,7-bisphosphate phosphatase